MSIFDQSFDNITATFAKNIYTTSKGKIRLAILKEDLTDFLLAADKQQVILDAGGGLGWISTWLAQYGHELTLVDISAEMVAEVNRITQTYNIDNIQSVHSSIQDYCTNNSAILFDWVICHAVLEWLADPQQVIKQLAGQLKSGGRLSLMFFNNQAKLLGNLIYGNFEYIDKGMKAKKQVKLNPQTQLMPEQVYTWLEEAGLKIIHKRGVRCFHDYMQNRQMHDSHYQDIERYEKQLSTQEPFISIAKYIHVIAEK